MGLPTSKNEEEHGDAGRGDEIRDRYRTDATSERAADIGIRKGDGQARHPDEGHGNQSVCVVDEPVR
jgi:hypothetical protein